MTAVTMVYAVDTRRKLRMRVDGVIHYTGGSYTHLWRTRCGLDISDTSHEDLGADESIAITCLACVGDRRPRWK